MFGSILKRCFKNLYLIFGLCLIFTIIGLTVTVIFSQDETTSISRYINLHNSLFITVSSSQFQAEASANDTKFTNKKNISMAITEDTPTPYNNAKSDGKQEELRVLLQCYDKTPKLNIYQKQSYWILENYIIADKRFKCYESITMTTQGDFTFIDNLLILIEKWQGPISVALYAPGDDFQSTLDSIAYLRNCHNGTLIKELVTFHLLYDYKHRPNLINTTVINAYLDKWQNCSNVPYDVIHDEIYRMKHQLTYPINIARNLARISSITHYVFPNDIELYPSMNFIGKFLEMIATHPNLSDIDPKVFVLPAFEIEEDQIVPKVKTELQKLVKEKKAFSFHAKLCNSCHIIPKFNEWIREPENYTLNVFTSSKRLGSQRDWEPFYIGTNNDPWFDERLTWEGQSNKIVQGFIMCLMDYDYMILDNAFLIHKPGIKKSKEQLKKYKKNVVSTNRLLKTDIRPDLINIYGRRKGCQWIIEPKKKLNSNTLADSQKDHSPRPV